MRHLLKNKKGSIAPGVVIIIMMMMMVGSLFFSLASIYAKRTVVRDSVDAAVTSALAAGAKEAHKDTYYYEYYTCIRGHYVEVEGADGKKSREWVCDEWGWLPASGAAVNYVYLNPGTARSTAEEFLKKNLDLNIKGTYKIKAMRFSYEYDKRRSVVITSERYFTAVSPSWWRDEFGDADPSPMTAVSTRTVRAPRWVSVTVEADVEVYTPLAKYFGDGTMDFTWKASAVMELKEVSH